MAVVSEVVEVSLVSCVLLEVEVSLTAVSEVAVLSCVVVLSS